MYGVVQSSGRDVPKYVMQKEMTHKKEKNRAQGTLRVEQLKGVPYFRYGLLIII